jgi:hypothetical protein
MEAHVRIDEGVKRGSRKPPNAKGANGKYLPLLPPEKRLQAIQDAAKRISNGEFLHDIAKDIGVTKQALSLWLLNECASEYKQAQRTGLISRIVDADSRIEMADNALDLARAREMARFARWDAERRLPSLFGPKQEITHSVAPILHIHTSPQADGVVIDQQPLIESKG